MILYYPKSPWNEIIATAGRPRFHPKQAARHHFNGSLVSTLLVPTLYQVK
jgi:hypothetical protein